MVSTTAAQAIELDFLKKAREAKMKIIPNPDQVAFAKHLDLQYGRKVARRYLQLVMSPNYLKSVGYLTQKRLP